MIGGAVDLGRGKLATHDSPHPDLALFGGKEKRL
jgi:hypothetical protein